MRLLPALLIVCLGTLMFAGYRVALAEPANPTPTARFTSESWDTEPAAGMLLVAARELRDPFFGQSVILLLQHDITGSKGLILNRLSDWRLSDVVSDIDGAQADQYPLFFGGPMGVHKVVMLVHTADAVAPARQVTDDIYFSDSRRVFERLLAARTPADELHFYLGYAGWTTGQLAGEIARGSWHLVEGDPKVVFGAGNKGLWEQMINELEPNGIMVQADSWQR
jgi:putative transcriptional regulator